MNIIKLQKNFLKKRFCKTLTNCSELYQNLFIITNINNNDGYIQFVEQINKKHVVQMTNTFLNRFYRLANISQNKITPRIFLSAFVIRFYSKYIFSKIQNLDEQYVYASATNLLCIFDMMLKNPQVQNDILRKFTKNLCEYKNAFDKYIKYDAQIKIDELIKEWCTDENMRLEIQNSPAYKNTEKICIDKIIENAQNKKLLLLKKIDASFDIHNLDKYLYVFQCMNKAYWDVLEAHILDDKYEMLLAILTEISDKICSFVPNNQKFISEFKEKFDLEILAQLQGFD